MGTSTDKSPSSLSNNRSRLSRVGKVHNNQYLRRRVLSYTHDQVKQLILKPKVNEDEVKIRPKSPDLTKIPDTV